MTRLVALLLAIILASGGCDPIRVILVSTSVPAPLPQPCVVEAIRSDARVKVVSVSDAGVVYVELIVPERLESPRTRLGFDVKEHMDEEGQRKFVFSMAWVGKKASADYRAWAEETMRQLQNRVVEMCGGSGTSH